ncbi:MAG TPA: M56 family metallopeptidase, partial [Polyangiaceae bacterium]
MPWFALALTYLVHSLVCAAVVAVLVHVRPLSSATRHLYWKVALIGPLLTAFVAVAVDGAAWHARGGAHVPDITVPSFTMLLGSEPGKGLNPPPGSRSNPRPALIIGAKSQLILRIGQCAAALGLLRFAGSALLLGHRLRRRTRVTDQRLLDRLARLRTRMGLQAVTLSESTQICSPLVIGRCEICIPDGVFAALSSAELDAVLAHELAHIERADGVWFPLAGAVQSVLWLQPLNHLLASYFRDSAELACDDRAVELTRDPLCLARALVQVATSASFARRSALLPTMVRSKNALLPRVRRLTRGTAANAPTVRECGRIQAIASLTLLACLLGAV